MATATDRSGDMACTCGARYGLDGTSDSFNGMDEKSHQSTRASTPSGSGIPSTPLDASFVHLPPSLLVQQEESRSLSYGVKTANAGGLMNGAAAACTAAGCSFDRYKHLAWLEKVANDASNPPPMCLDCVQRVQRAMESDSNRIEAESRVYRETVLKENSRIKSWKRALRAASVSDDSTSKHAGDVSVDPSASSLDDEVERAAQSFRSEIDSLLEMCRNHEEELLHLQSVRQELCLFSKQLDQAEEAMYQERNSLEMEAESFNNDQEQLYRMLAEIQGELERLSSPSIRLPALLLDLQVDKERGLRYPLINDLRLAYRPKGDVQWEEIQAAWSLAAQLLLYVATLFNFQSRHWRVVPLSSCAKVIFYPPKADNQKTDSSHRSNNKKRAIVYNLGHPKTHSSRAFLAWNALLHQLASCVLGKMSKACDEGMMESEMVPRLPYEMTQTKIGTIVLTELDENDDAGWSRAIHCMSSNLQWLSDCASVFLLHQILPQCL